MGKSTQRITPFLKQCFVVFGVVLNMSQFGLVLGYTTCLLPQLRAHDSTIQIDETQASWIASLVSIVILPSTFITPSIMSKYGRKIAKFISIVLIIAGWLAIALATNVTWLLVARFIQGFSLGINTVVGPVLIGEYTTPKYRASFLAAITVTMCAGTLFVHSVGLYLNWKVTALTCALISFGNLLITIVSPESPSWLIDQGRYEEGERVFRWLRGVDEDHELKKMIEVNEVKVNKEQRISESFTKKMKNNIEYLRKTMKRKEFFRPIIIGSLGYVLIQWCGVNGIAAFAEDLVRNIVGNVEYPPIIISVDIQRVLSNSSALYVAHKIKRKTLLANGTGLLILALLATAGYVYGKQHELLPFDHPMIGVALIHLHTLCISAAVMPICYIIQGEIFPLAHRGLMSAVCTWFLTLNMFLNLKSVLPMLKNIGLPGTYCVYAAISSCCVVVMCLLLPETKDKTLLEIEEEFRGKPLVNENDKNVQMLMLE